MWMEYTHIGTLKEWTKRYTKVCQYNKVKRGEYALSYNNFKYYSLNLMSISCR